MRTDETPVNAPPKFCRLDGMQLMDAQSEIPMGFDAFTGTKLPAQPHITRRCPTPAHDVWVLSHDRQMWVRP